MLAEETVPAITEIKSPNTIEKKLKKAAGLNAVEVREKLLKEKEYYFWKM